MAGPFDAKDVQRIVKCYSRVAIVRCQGLSERQRIGLFVPAAVQVLLVPVLLVTAWSRPSATLLFLSVEILLDVAISTWSFAVDLQPPRRRFFAVEDTALAVTSSLPTLFLLLAITSILIATLRPSLPRSMRSTIVTNIYSVLVLPLVPIGFIGTLLGSFLLIQYEGNSISGFVSESDSWVHAVITAAGAVSISAYILFVLCLSSILFFSLPSRKKWTRHHPYRPLLSLAILDIGLALSCAEHAITLVSLSFTILVVRRALKLAAMIFLVVGFLLVDKPRSSPSLAVEAKTTTDAPRHARSRSSFGQMPDRIRIPSRRVARNRSKTASGATGKGLRGQIGNPLDETFRKMTTDETRDFHATKAGGKNAAVGDGKKVSFVKPAERVVFRTPTARAPVLSFTSSAFSASSLTYIARVVQPDLPIRQLEFKNDFSQVRCPDVAGNSILTRSSVKKNFGSIYYPERLSVQESDLAEWPPATSSLSRPEFSRTVPVASTIAVPPNAVTAQEAAGKRFSRNRGSSDDAGRARVRFDQPHIRQLSQPHPYALISPDTGDRITLRDIPRRRAEMSLYTPSMEPALEKVKYKPTLQRSNTIITNPFELDIEEGDEPSVPARPNKHPGRRIVRSRAMQQSIEIELGQFPSPPDMPALVEPHSLSRDDRRNGESSTRPQGERRDTDPTIAMDPSIASGSLPELVSRSITASPRRLSSSSSDVSTYSLEEIHPRSLFFATPAESPSSSDHTVTPLNSSSINFASSPSRSGPNTSLIRQSPMTFGSSSEDSFGTTIPARAYLASRYRGSGEQVVDGDGTRHRSEVQSVLASLHRLQRDAGIEADPNRLSLIREFGGDGYSPRGGSYDSLNGDGGRNGEDGVLRIVSDDDEAELVRGFSGQSSPTIVAAKSARDTAWAKRYPGNMV